jgi:hypothetical protein
MRTIATLALAATATLGFAQIRYDDITLRNMTPQWGTLMVGAYGTFNQPCQFAVTSYDQWSQMWPSIAGQYYERGMEVPRFIDWNTEQIVFISLGNVGQGYGIYVEEVRRTSSFQFDVRYAVSTPNIQIGVGYQQTSYQSFSFGMGNTPFLAFRVPRSYGIPAFHQRFYQPPSYVIRTGCGCGHCNTHNNQVWMFGKGGVLMPYTPPGQPDKKNGGN